MSRQGTLFGMDPMDELPAHCVRPAARPAASTSPPIPRAVEPRDPNVTTKERPRLKGQNGAILERLERGPATNSDLAALSLNYRARISDLRAAGYIIPPPLEDQVTGVALYRLEGWRPEPYDPKGGAA